MTEQSRLSQAPASPGKRGAMMSPEDVDLGHSPLEGSKDVRRRPEEDGIEGAIPRKELCSRWNEWVPCFFGLPRRPGADRIALLNVAVRAAVDEHAALVVVAGESGPPAHVLESVGGDRLAGLDLDGEQA